MRAQVWVEIPEGYEPVQADTTGVDFQEETEHWMARATFAVKCRKTPPPMPELVRVDDCAESVKEVSIGCGDTICKASKPSGYARLYVFHPDELICRLAFNAAAKVLNKGKP